MVGIFLYVWKRDYLKKEIQLQLFSNLFVSSSFNFYGFYRETENENDLLKVSSNVPSFLDSEHQDWRFDVILWNLKHELHFHLHWCCFHFSSFIPHLPPFNPPCLVKFILEFNPPLNQTRDSWLQLTQKLAPSVLGFYQIVMTLDTIVWWMLFYMPRIIIIWRY